MARILKEEEYNAKRGEILDMALKLVYSKGYEQMTIQDILDGLNISRGAFYHYFDSKQALLEALVERMGSEGGQAMLAIVEDPHLTAIEKFRRYFETSAQWKNASRELIFSLMRVWYSDDNLFIRQKMTENSRNYTSRLLEPMIRQGIAEKVFNTRYPKQVAVIIAGAAMSISDRTIELLLSPVLNQEVVQELQDIQDAYIDTIERILGAPTGSLKVSFADIFKDWLVKPEPASE